MERKALIHYVMDERLEHSWRLVYYEVPGEPAIAGCNTAAVSSPQSEIYLGRCGRTRMLFVDRHCVNVFIHVLNFCGLSQLRN